MRNDLMARYEGPWGTIRIGLFAGSLMARFFVRDGAWALVLTAFAGLLLAMIGVQAAFGWSDRRAARRLGMEDLPP